MDIELEKIHLNNNPQEVDIWDELPDNIRASVEKSISQAENGELIPHDEAIKKVKRWH